MKTFIPAENNDTLASVRGFLRQLMENQVVEAIYSPLRVDDYTVTPGLVTETTLLDQADPLTPIMPINGARAVASLTRTGEHSRLGAVLRPCEIRGLLELVKLKQASLGNTIIIGLDCPGTYETVEFNYVNDQGNFELPVFLESAATLSSPIIDGLELRTACQMCTQPLPEHADIHLHLFGYDHKQGVHVTANDELSSDLSFLGDSEIQADKTTPDLQQFLANRHDIQREKVAEIQKKIETNGGFSGLFANCIRCHNCMTVCPICYCKTCLFRTQAFDHAPDHYYGAARRKGALRMLPDTVLFHMTRLNHMSLSCVSCGMCTSACPVDIPVGTIFTAIGSQVQAVFEYSPGRDVDDPIPLTTYQAEEWTTIGE